MDGNTFKGLEAAFNVILVMLVVFVPLGCWQLIEIVVWLFQHIRWQP